MLKSMLAPPYNRNIVSDFGPRKYFQVFKATLIASSGAFSVSLANIRLALCALGVTPFVLAISKST